MCVFFFFFFLLHSAYVLLYSQVVRQVVDALHLPGEQRVDLGSVVGEVVDDQLVDPRRAVPVVLVPGELGQLAGHEMLVGERAGADGVAHVEVGRDDPDGVFGQQLVEHRVRRVELQQDRPRVDDLRVVQFQDRGQLDAAGAGLFRVGDHGEAVHDVLGGQRLAMVELHAVAQPDRPLGVVLVRRDGLGDRRLDLVLGVPAQQWLVELQAATDVRIGNREVRLQRVLEPAAGGAVAVDTAAHLWCGLVRLARHRAAARQAQSGEACRGDHAGFEHVAAGWPRASLRRVRSQNVAAVA